MKHLKPLKLNEISSPAGSIEVDIANLSSTARYNNANPAIELEEEIDELNIEDTLTSLSNEEIKNFFITESPRKISSEIIRNYVESGKDNYTMGQRLNLVEEELVKIITNRFINGDIN